MQPFPSSLAELYARIKRDIRLEIRTVIPARVVTYNAATQRAKVELGTQQVRLTEDGTEATDAALVIDGVPVRFPSSANCALTFPLPAGTTGHVVICDRSPSAWLSDGNAHPPPLPHTHNLADAVFEPGLRPESNPHTPASMGGVALTGPTVQLGTAAATQALVRGTELEPLWDAVVAYLLTHVHPSTGAPPTPPVVPPLSIPAQRGLPLSAQVFTD